MEYIDGGRVWRYIFGDRHHRWAVIASVVGLLGLASVAFLLGMDVGLYEFPGWMVIVPVIAVVAGIVGAGLVPTVGSLWLIGLWGYAFPPLIGYQWQVDGGRSVLVSENAGVRIRVCPRRITRRTQNKC